MMWSNRLSLVVLISVCMAMFAIEAGAVEPPDVNVGVDLYSRYVWRGFDIGSNPSIQPTISAQHSGFELGAWAAYSLSTDSSGDDEIDFWSSYSFDADNGAGFSLIVTDYYFPNSGVEFSESNAHTIEVGGSIRGPQGFPMTFSGYVNVQNDDGNNTYFQLDYPASAGEVELGFFLGLAGGSAENPGYYATDSANVVNVGMSATKPIAVSDTFVLPITGLVIYNPRLEVAHIVVGASF